MPVGHIRSTTAKEIFNCQAESPNLSPISKDFGWQ